MQGRELDYLIINHMEPDHCGNIENLVRRYPNVKVVGNKKSFQLFNTSSIIWISRKIRCL